MIKIVTLDDAGHILGNHDAPAGAVTLPVVALDPLALSETIRLHPDCPPLGSVAFRRWLEAWHAQHNQAGETCRTTP